MPDKRIVIVSQDGVLLAIEHFESALAADKFIAVMTTKGYDVADYKEVA